MTTGSGQAISEELREEIPDICILEEPFRPEINQEALVAINRLPRIR
jgi:hypothetical protein